MNLRKNRILVGVGLAWALVASTPSAKAQNLLVDPSFELNPLISYSSALSDFAAYQGNWGVERAKIKGDRGGCVRPPDGVKHLSMADDGDDVTWAVQVTDVTSYAALIDGGQAKFDLSALFNLKKAPAGEALVTMRFFSGPSLGHEIFPPAQRSVILDRDCHSWHLPHLCDSIPPGTRWMVSRVGFVNATMEGKRGYVDRVRFTISMVDCDG